MSQIPAAAAPAGNNREEIWERGGRGQRRRQQRENQAKKEEKQFRKVSRKKERGRKRVRKLRETRFFSKSKRNLNDLIKIGG